VTCFCNVELTASETSSYRVRGDNSTLLRAQQRCVMWGFTLQIEWKERAKVLSSAQTYGVKGNKIEWTFHTNAGTLETKQINARDDNGRLNQGVLLQDHRFA
jgi:hypothetical protein